MPVYSCTITTITPLHIGDGGELRRDFDYVIKDKKTYRLNEDEIIKAKIKQIEEKLKRGECPPPGKLLNENDYSNPRLFRYVLNNVPRSDKPDARLKSCIKDCFDVPYIPGSSIKGALRTALAFEGWRKKNIILKEKIDKIPRNSKFPAESLEKEIFGENPNKDLLRSLHVSDFTPAENVNTEKIIRVVNMQVITQSKEVHL
jgi:CRISPR-associated protein Csm5